MAVLLQHFNIIAHAVQLVGQWWGSIAANSKVAGAGWRWPQRSNEIQKAFLNAQGAS